MAGEMDMADQKRINADIARTLALVLARLDAIERTLYRPGGGIESHMHQRYPASQLPTPLMGGF